VLSEFMIESRRLLDASYRSDQSVLCDNSLYARANIVIEILGSYLLSGSLNQMGAGGGRRRRLSD